MRNLRFALPVVLVCAWGLAVGCDDNRPVVDDPVGGVGNFGGEPAASGGAEDPGTAGAGPAAGQGGAAPVLECPPDLLEAENDDCSDFAEGFICSDGGTDPCEFGNSILCTNGVWERREAFPAPCGGAGGVGAGGQAEGGAPLAGGVGGQGGG